MNLINTMSLKIEHTCFINISDLRNLNLHLLDSWNHGFNMFNMWLSVTEQKQFVLIKATYMQSIVFPVSQNFVRRKYICNCI